MTGIATHVENVWQCTFDARPLILIENAVRKKRTAVNRAKGYQLPSGQISAVLLQQLY